MSSASEPVSLQPTSSSLLKIAAPEHIDDRGPVKPVNPVLPVDPVQLNSSSSSLMEASCETEILELELNRSVMTGNADTELGGVGGGGGVVTCHLVSFSDDPAFSDPLKLPEPEVVAPEVNFTEETCLVPPNGKTSGTADSYHKTRHSIHI